MDDSPADLAGRQVDQFRLDRFLGPGAVGMVFKAFDTVLRRTVALRLVPKTDPAGATEAERAAFQEARKRLILEAKAAGSLGHPHIAAIHALGETGDFDYLCTEYVSGRTLSQILSEQQILGVKEALDLLEQVLQVLAAAGEEGIVHRDLKPSNIMIEDEGRVKVMDFGIAGLPFFSSTIGGMFPGTSPYMSPEQISGQAVDIRSDIFSAGTVLYEALTGERPFTAADTAALSCKIREVDPIPARVLNIHVPEAVDELLKKALAKDPADRFQTPTAMLKALRVVLQAQAEAGAGENGTEEMGVFRREGGNIHPRARTTEGFGTMTGQGNDQGALEHRVTQSFPGERGETAAPWLRFGRIGALMVLPALLAGGGMILWRLHAKPVVQTSPVAGEAAVVLAGSPQQHPASDRLVSTVDVLVEKAKSLWESEPAMTQKLLEEACAADPNHFDAAFQLARFLTFRKEFPAALQQYQKALRINDQVPDVFFNLGYIYLSQGAIDQAIENYRACQALSPAYLDEVLTNLAVCYWKKNDPAQARALLKQALELNPKNEPARNFLNTLEKPLGG